MIALIQRVSEASVTVEGEVTGAIANGLLVLLGVEQGDDETRADKLLHKVSGYRIFSDEEGKMNLNVSQVGGSLLVVSQFTLAADTGSGLRPSFSTAAAPAEAERIYDRLVIECAKRHPRGVETGRFRAHMEVSLVNDGPVTFLLRT